LALALGSLFLALVVASFAGPIQLRWVYWGLAGIASSYLAGVSCRHLFGWLGRQELFSPLWAFPIAYVVWYGLGSLALLGDEDSRTLIYSAAGLLCYLAGVIVVGKGSLLKSSSLEIREEWTRSAFRALSAGLAVLALLAYLYVISQMGIPALDPESAERRLEVTKYGPSEAVLFTASWTLLTFVLAYLWTHEERRVVRLLGLFTVLVLSLALLSLGSRGYLFVPLLTAMVARHYLKKRFHLVTLTVIGVVVFMCLSVYGYVRDSTLPKQGLSVSKESVNGLAVFPLIYAYLYVRQPVETFQQVTEVIPRTIPYQRGLLTFGALRTLLPGHHEMSDMFFKQILGSDFVGGGQPATVLGPLYGDFGLTGILLGMFTVGAIVAQAYKWMRRNPTLFRVLIYAWVMQTLLFSLFGAIFPYITTVWIPVFWWAIHSLFLKRQLALPATA
jgi:oligosaccharide repeat unit polymerase